MNYLLSIKQSAFKVLANIDQPQRQRHFEAIEKLKSSPSAGSDLKGEFSGLRRIRVGDYRIVYEVQDAQLMILVIRTADWKEVYK